ncbi:MAG: hypothetical protein IKF90_11955, partial [Parasporobacterium sp.]|nr:hypothetical protein [Parasporobacterium sp.]
KRRCGGAGKVGRTPPSKQKAAMRRGRKGRANPSVKAKSGDAEGQEKMSKPLRVDFLKKSS